MRARSMQGVVGLMTVMIDLCNEAIYDLVCPRTQAGSAFVLVYFGSCMVIHSTGSGYTKGFTPGFPPCCHSCCVTHNVSRRPSWMSVASHTGSQR